MATKITNSQLPRYVMCHMEGPHPPDDFVSNGCTLSPDSISGADLRPACHVHDFGYMRGGGESWRLEIDRRFYRNLIRCGAPRWLAGIYFRRVRWHGRRLWLYWEPSDRPRGFWPLAKLWISRYFTW